MAHQLITLNLYGEDESCKQEVSWFSDSDAPAILIDLPPDGTLCLNLGTDFSGTVSQEGDLSLAAGSERANLALPEHASSYVFRWKEAARKDEYGDAMIRIQHGAGSFTDVVMAIELSDTTGIAIDAEDRPEFSGVEFIDRWGALSAVLLVAVIAFVMAFLLSPVRLELIIAGVGAAGIGFGYVKDYKPFKARWTCAGLCLLFAVVYFSGVMDPHWALQLAYFCGVAAVFV